MTKTRYEVIEIRVRRRSSLTSYDLDDCEITQTLGGYEPYYFDNKEDAKEFIYDRYGKMSERDQYNSAFNLSEVYYDEIDECYMPTNYFDDWYDLWMDTALEKSVKASMEEPEEDVKHGKVF